jgi:hypothetical protein
MVGGEFVRISFSLMEQKSGPRKTLAEKIDDLEAEIEVYKLQLNKAIKNNDAGEKKLFGELITGRGAYLHGLKDELRLQSMNGLLENLSPAGLFLLGLFPLSLNFYSQFS